MKTGRKTKSQIALRRSNTRVTEHTVNQLPLNAGVSCQIVISGPGKMVAPAYRMPGKMPGNMPGIL
jgi:hypothetical protein